MPLKIQITQVQNDEKGHPFGGAVRDAQISTHKLHSKAHRRVLPRVPPSWPRNSTPR